MVCKKLKINFLSEIIRLLWNKVWKNSSEKLLNFHDIG